MGIISDDVNRVLSALAFLGGLFLGAVTWAWKARGLKAEIDKRIDDEVYTLKKAIDDATATLRSEQLSTEDDLRADYSSRIEAAHKDFILRQEAGFNQVGEGLAALREKTNQIELWTRDNLVNQRAFDTLTRSLEEMAKDIKEEHRTLRSEISKIRP